MNIEEQKNGVKRRIKIDGIVFALICIIIGIVFLGRNTGLITQNVFDVLISWRMLLAIIGLYTISHRGYLVGVIIFGIGVFFMVPLVTGQGNWVQVYWPLIFVFAGLLMLVKIILPKGKRCRHHHDNMITNYSTKDGFVYSENSFSGTRHVVMDEVFKGARIINSFGATELDLRRTTIEQGDTYIDIDCRYGGIEIHVPENWLVLTEVNSSMSGVTDDRTAPLATIDETRRLVLRGKLSLSGVVLKN